MDSHRLGFAASPYGILYYAQDGMIVMANAAAGRILGLSADQLMGQGSANPSWRVIRADGTPFPDQDRPGKECLRTGRPVENVIMGVAGPNMEGVRWLEVSASPLFLPGEDLPRQAMVTLHDVTARRQSQEALQESEGRFRTFFEAGPDAVFVRRVGGPFLEANSKALQRYGYSLEEFRTLQPFDLAPPRLKAEARERDQEWLRNGRPFEWVHQARDGTEIPVEVTLQEMDLHGVPCLIGRVRDLTEQRLAEQRAKAAQARFEAALDSAMDPMVMTDADGNFIEFNQAWAAYCRVGSREACPRTYEAFRDMFEVCLPTGEPVAAELGVVPRALRGERAAKMELLLRHRASGAAWIGSYSFGPILDEGGAVVGSMVTVRDVSERKAAEAQIREKEALLRLFVEHSPAAIAMLDTGMNYLVASRRWMEDYRLPQRDIVGLNHYRLFPDLPAQWVAIHERCLAGAVERCEEDPFPRADGILDWVRWEIRPWHRADGLIGGLIISSEVITERKRAADALERNQDMLARTEQAVHLGSWSWEVDTDTVTWSAELFNILQIDPAQGALPYAELGRIYPPEETARLRKASERAVAEGVPYDLELKVIRPDGEVRICAARGNPERSADGKVHFVHGWLQDITERKRVEKALQESEEQYRMLFESAQMGVSLQEIILDAHGRPFDLRILQVNQAAARWAGLSADYQLNHTVREMFPDLGTGWLEGYLRIAATGEPDHFEGFIPATRRHLDFHVHPIRPGQFVVITQDMTETKRAEQLHADLREALRSQAAQLRKAQENERLRISREIHDDLGQLTTALKIEMGLLEHKLSEPGLPSSCNALVDKAVQAGVLTDSIQATVNRIAAELRPSLVDQLGLEGAIRHEARRIRARAGLDCVVLPEGPCPEVPREFKGEVFYICREALTNVLRHAQATRAEVGWRQEGGAAFFTVTDDGIGMGALDLEVKPAVGLTGMRERAALCGGMLTLEPNPPHGTKVTVRVPLAGPAERSMDR
jgi:PAS domain S-box-containing protein